MIRDGNRARLPLQAGEVLEATQDFASTRDPRDAVLGDRTVVMWDTLSMPLAAREASIYMPKIVLHAESPVSLVREVLPCG